MLDKTGGFLHHKPARSGLIRLMGGIHYGKKMWMVDELIIAFPNLTNILAKSHIYYLDIDQNGDRLMILNN